jgi:hypothetical protein
MLVSNWRPKFTIIGERTMFILNLQTKMINIMLLLFSNLDNLLLFPEFGSIKFNLKDNLANF